MSTTLPFSAPLGNHWLPETLMYDATGAEKFVRTRWEVFTTGFQTSVISW